MYMYMCMLHTGYLAYGCRETIFDPSYLEPAAIPGKRPH